MIFKRTFSAFLAAVLAFAALCLPASANNAPETDIAASVVTSDFSSTAAVMMNGPSSSFGSGSYIVKEGFRITLSGTLSTDEIWYSLNGTGYRRYTEPLSITQSTTVRAYLVRFGMQSSVAEYEYNLIPLMSISQGSGTYNGVQRIFINCETFGAKIYYTLDGSTPTEHSNEYSASSGILIGTSATLKVVAIKTGWYRFVREYNYTIIGGRDVSNDNNPDGGLEIVSTTEKTTSLLDNYTEKWGYNQLTAVQKSAYEKVFDAAKSYTAQIDLSKLNIKASDFEKAYWAFDYDNPQFLMLGNGYSYSYYVSTGYLKSATILYSRTRSEIAPIEITFETIVNRVISNAKTQLTDYGKLKYIHDWIVNNTDYTLNGPAYKSEADGAVVYGKALCEGYSKTFMYMAQKLGFDCICVVGKANGVAHMWNMVKLGGSWYHVDVTFDDPIMSDGSKALYHDHFLIGTYEINKTHTIDNPIGVPSAPRSYVT